MWQDEWPTEPGYYWFFGWESSEDEKPKMHLAEVFRTSLSAVHIVDGHFLYKEEGAKGKWMKATLPEPPNL